MEQLVKFRGASSKASVARAESWTLLHPFNVFENENITQRYIWRQQWTEMIVYCGSLATRLEKEKQRNVYEKVLHTHKITRIRKNLI
jgi:hypothetical protein